MNDSPLSKFPLIRIAIPFSVGIMTGNSIPVPFWMPPAIACFGLLMFALLTLFSNAPERRIRIRPYFSLPLFTIAFALGWTTFVVHQPPQLNLTQVNGKVGYGTIESLQFKEQSMSMVVKLRNPHTQGSTILLTTRGCNYSLTEGDDIAFKLNLQKIGSTNMPGDTDYATILRRKGLLYTQHTATDAIVRYHHTASFDSKMANLRRYLKRSILSSGITSTAKHYIIALILGDKRYIDKQTKNEYAHAGLSHLLALSGLHIGIIMMLIWLILWPLDYYGLKKLRFLLSLGMVLLYDCLTGLPPSVVRATVMIGFTFATFIFGRKSSAINALMASAMIILVMSPISLYNAGFQLSFVTVIFILLFSPGNQVLSQKHKWANYFISLIAISVIATLATTALTAYYFQSISWAGVIANLFAIPVFTVFMGVAVVMILLSIMQVDIEMVNQVANGLVVYLNGVAKWVSTLPGTYIKEVYFSPLDVICYFICVVMLLLFITRRKWWYMNMGLVCCALGIFLHTLVANRLPSQGCVLPASFRNAPIIFYRQSTAWYWLPDDRYHTFDAEEFRIFHSGFFAKYGIDDFLEATDGIAIPQVAIHAPLAHISNRTFLVAGRNLWKRVRAGKKIDVDYCVITRHFNSTIEELQTLYRIKCVVIAGDVYQPNIPILAQQCKEKGIPIRDLRAHTLVID